MTLPTALELLRIRAEGSFDERGRVAGADGVTIACTDEGQALWIGAAVPEALAGELTAAFERAPASPVSHDPMQPPPALAPCHQLLAADGRAWWQTAGPSYLIEAGAEYASSVRIERSDRADTTPLRGANPGGWHPVEWNELLDGSLGPWAFALEGDAVVSICHTPAAPTARAAECGVGTHPAFRGRGYAAAVTSVWAAMVRPSGRYLFYSTDAENLSSQRVAQRLGLRPLGWTWRLGSARPDERGQIHPLCSLRRSPT